MHATTKHPIEVGDKTYQVSALSDEARDALDEWVRRKFVDGSMDIVNAIADADTRDRAIDRLFAQSMSITWASPKGAELMATPEGQAYLFFVACKQNHPELTFEELKAQFFDPETVVKCNAVFRELNINRPKRELKSKRKGGKKGQGKTRRTSQKRKSTSS